MQIIGLIGGSASGKTTLANKIVSQDKNISIIRLDSYYKDGGHLSLEQRDKVNYDHPDAFEYSLLVSHLKELKKGNCIPMPTYNYATMLREDKTIEVCPNKIILVEGILVMANQELKSHLDKTIFFDIPFETRLERNCKRDMNERGRDYDSSYKRFNEVVEPMFKKYLLPEKINCDRIINDSVSLHEILEYIHS